MTYNSLPYEELVKVARALAHGMRIDPPIRGIGEFEIEHDIVVVAKERPRNSTFHTPKRTRDFERAVQTVARQAMQREKFYHPFEFPLFVDLEIRQSPPKSWSETRYQLAQQRMCFITQRDLDNMEKAIMDAFNGVVYQDDRQIVSVNKRNVTSKTPGYTARFTPIGLTKNETDRAEKIARQIRAGNLD